MGSIKQLPSDSSHKMVVEFSGNINENCEIFSLDLNGLTHLELNLAGLKYINSVGVKSWVNWVSGRASKLNVSLRACTVLFINQINLVVGFIPKNFVIESFQVPYFCNECSDESNLILIKNMDFFYATAKIPKKIVLPTINKCKNDKSEMELDVIYLKYFNFLDYPK